MQRRWQPLLALVAATGLVACPEASTPQGSPAPSSASPPPVASVPPVPSSAPSAPKAEPDAASTAVLHVRPLRALVAKEEWVRLLIHWHGADGYLDASHPDAIKVVDWSTAEVTLTTKGPDGETRSTVKLHDAGIGERRLLDAATILLAIHPSGELSVEVPASSERDPIPVSQLLETRGQGMEALGTYRLQAEVSMTLGGEARTFRSSSAAEVERRDDILPLDAIQEAARMAMIDHLKRSGRSASIADLRGGTRTVDEGPKHLRRVRFQVPDPEGKWSLLFFEVVVRPNGAVVTIHEQTRFTCVAEGTPIATPQGPRPIEDLAVGDAVWGYDVSRGARTVTHVRAISEPRLARTVRLDGLTLTGNHPVYREGRWVGAGHLAVGATTLSPDGPRALRTVREGGWARVVDLSVDFPHTYFAAGILVHNKKIQVPPWRFDPWFVLYEDATGEYELLPSATRRLDGQGPPRTP